MFGVRVGGLLLKERAPHPCASADHDDHRRTYDHHRTYNYDDGRTYDNYVYNVAARDSAHDDHNAASVYTAHYDHDAVPSASTANDDYDQAAYHDDDTAHYDHDCSPVYDDVDDGSGGLVGWV